jgi:alkyldihydroxyacetonephosphate synthase
VGPSDKPILVINLRKLNKLLSLDEISLTAAFQPGILGPELEVVLNERGYTLGHFPQSFEFSTLGGWVATRSAGQNSTKYGRIDKLVVSLKAQTPRGSIETRPVPASAAGPSLKEIWIGSEGIYGILTEITIKIARLPQTQRFVGAFFKDFGVGVHAVRKMIQAGLHPSILRLSDATETSLFRKMQPMSGWKEAAFSLWLRMKKAGNAPSLLLLTTEGDREESVRQESLLRKSLQKNGAAVLSKGLSEKIGTKWLKNRFALPYLRDDFMDHSFFIDTLETATLWSGLERLHGRMRTAFEAREKKVGEKVLVGCHLSHAYADGASLYFTLIAAQRKNEELRQWDEIKKLATDTIMENGGTVSHHHGVGYDHRPWMKQEKTELGIQVLRQIKSQLDPDRLLNPEKTI